MAVDVYIAESGPLGAPALRTMAQAGIINDSGVLSDLSIVVLEDVVDLLVPGTSIYLMDLITPDGNVRVPISSWQATLQTGAQNYVQCVVPAALAYAASLSDATDFVISRQLYLSDGSTMDYQMAGAPLTVVQLDQGPTNYTATLSGYTDAYPEDLDPPTDTDRTLTGVRSVSTYEGGAMRVRCDVDFALRPGQRAYYDTTPIIVSYINFYAPGGDQYMDVGGT